MSVYNTIYRYYNIVSAVQPYLSAPAPARVPSQDRTSQLGPLRKALWEVRAKWEDIGIDIGIPMGTTEVYIIHF